MKLQEKEVSKLIKIPGGSFTEREPRGKRICGDRKDGRCPPEDWQEAGRDEPDTEGQE